MLSQGLKFFTDVPIILVGLIIFVSIFVILTCLTFFRKESQSVYTKVSRFPLAGEENNE